MNASNVLSLAGSGIISFCKAKTFEWDASTPCKWDVPHLGRPPTSNKLSGTLTASLPIVERSGLATPQALRHAAIAEQNFPHCILMAQSVAMTVCAICFPMKHAFWNKCVSEKHRFRHVLPPNYFFTAPQAQRMQLFGGIHVYAMPTGSQAAQT